jgi:hypothetical protein
MIKRDLKLLLTRTTIYFLIDKARESHSHFESNSGQSQIVWMNYRIVCVNAKADEQAVLDGILKAATAFKVVQQASNKQRKANSQKFLIPKIDIYFVSSSNRF